RHAAEDHAAAVDEVDAGQRARRVDRPVDPHGDVGLPGGAGDGAVLLGDVGVLRHLHAGEHVRDGLAALDDVGDRVEAAGHRLEQGVERDAALRVDQITTGHGPSTG